MSAEAKRAERRGGAGPRRRRRLLVVDEDAWCRGIADGILRASGHRVVCTGDAATAVGIARNMLPDLILADLRLDLIEPVPFLERRRLDGAAVFKPVARIADGYAVLRPLEVDPGLVSCPVVVLRDLNETEDALDGPRFGVPDYLSKPFTAEVLLEKVERSLHTTGLEEALSGSYPGTPALRARRDTDPWNPHEALMSGTLDFVGVPAVLEMFHFNQLSGVCELRAHDGHSAEVGFEEGEIVTASTSDGLGGADAVFHIVAWTRGRFAFSRARPLSAAPLKTRFEQLILEGLRRLDEQRRGVPALALDSALKGLNFRES
jgi:CheY-like chemotaxis protein